MFVLFLGLLGLGVLLGVPSIEVQALENPPVCSNAAPASKNGDPIPLNNCPPSSDDLITPKGNHPIYQSIKVVTKLEDVPSEVARNEPFILRELVNRWSGYKKFSLDYFVEEFGEAVASAQHNAYPTVRVDHDNFEISFAELKKLVIQSDGGDDDGDGSSSTTKAQNHNEPPIYGALTLNLEQRNKVWGDLHLPPTLQDDDFMRCLGSKQLVDDFLGSFFWSQLFVGASGTGMEMHSDMIRTHVWTAQIEGEKQAVFCPPGSKKFDAFSTTVPHDDRGDCLWAALQPGELLFWPSTWRHQTFNSQGPSVAVSGMAVPEGDLAKLFDITISRHPMLKMKKGLAKNIHRCSKEAAEGKLLSKAIASILTAFGMGS
ncbi:hypothetical protein TrVE_jg747 [Triparma verrucosa]|uniref:JmjC domain-containing protein n=1 Tax=Triparma verrucosa TaxID=1606542 RepID=A0A9W7KRS6_9STRA|nr:hypothetical protein TrVE_jg747 [Triparma verrucosa]